MNHLSTNRSRLVTTFCLLITTGIGSAVPSVFVIPTRKVMLSTTTFTNVRQGLIIRAIPSTIINTFILVN